MTCWASGRTTTSGTSPTWRFAEYFGCHEVEFRKVRTWFRKEADKLGLTSAEMAASLAPDEQMAISEFTEGDVPAVEAEE